VIELRGTSHIASDDLSNIRELITQRQPDVVALELDEQRLQALLTEEQRHTPHNPFFLLLKKIQEFLGKQTGAMPGSDMLEAFKTAVDDDRDVALIDQDITVTLRKLKGVSLLEKIKFVGFIVMGAVLFPVEQFDLQDVPDDELIHRLLLQFRVSFPQMYDVLVTERNQVMAEKLQALDQQYDHVLAFVGAGHVEGLQEQLRQVETAER
jgi:pheromone shutdown protein TraB